jgi:hypothetical protein
MKNKLIFLIILLGFFSIVGRISATTLDSVINAKLNDFDTDFYFQTDSDASTGFDYLDFAQTNFPNGNYSFLFSNIGSYNLTMDVWPPQSRTLNLVYKVNPSVSGSLNLSWSTNAFGSDYSAVLTDYGSDSSYSTSEGSADMKSVSSYKVSHSGTTRYFRLAVTYFYCGDGICSSTLGETCSGCVADCGCSTGYSCTNSICVVNPSSGSELPPVVPPVTPPVIPPEAPPALPPVTPPTPEAIPPAIVALAQTLGITSVAQPNSVSGSCILNLSNYVCGNWTGCDGEYNIEDILSEQYIAGVQERKCIDKTKCLPSFMQKANCSLKQEVAVKNTNWCNQEYTEVLDNEGKVVARIKKTLDSKAVNVDLNADGQGYCAYCFDGLKDFDETDIDCGGSCISCSAQLNVNTKAFYQKDLFKLSLSLLSFFIFLMLAINFLADLTGVNSTITNYNSLIKEYEHWKKKGYDVGIIEKDIKLLFKK